MIQLSDTTTYPPLQAHRAGWRPLKELEDAISEAIDLIEEAGADLSEGQAARLAGWGVPLDAFRSEVRRIRGQRHGRLVEEGEE